MTYLRREWVLHTNQRRKGQFLFVASFAADFRNILTEMGRPVMFRGGDIARRQDAHRLRNGAVYETLTTVMLLCCDIIEKLPMPETARAIVVRWSHELACMKEQLIQMERAGVERDRDSVTASHLRRMIAVYERTIRASAGSASWVSDHAQLALAS
jgi:hypothetical protein